MISNYLISSLDNDQLKMSFLWKILNIFLKLLLKTFNPPKLKFTESELLENKSINLIHFCRFQLKTVLCFLILKVRKAVTIIKWDCLWFLSIQFCLTLDWSKILLRLVRGFYNFCILWLKILAALICWDVAIWNHQAWTFILLIIMLR